MESYSIHRFHRYNTLVIIKDFNSDKLKEVILSIIKPENYKQWYLEVKHECTKVVSFLEECGVEEGNIFLHVNNNYNDWTGFAVQSYILNSWISQ